MITQIKIIDNKKVSMSNDEWTYFQSICESYNRPNFRGEELFKNLFETDDDGIIVFLKTPSTRYTSIEVFLFVVALQQQQHLRIMYGQLQGLMNEVRSVLNDKTSNKQVSQ